MDSEELLEQDQFEKLIQGLLDDDYGCCNDFILASTVAGLSTEITNLSDLGSMNPSGVGNKIDFQKNIEIRGDKINWIEEQSTNQFE